MALNISKAESTFKDQKGRKIYYRSYIPEKIMLQVVLIHGFAEHMGYYHALAQMLSEKGVLVHLLDLPGHGRSEGIRGHIEDFDEFSDTVYQFVLVNPNYQKAQPTFLIGHSMGALVSLRYCMRFSPNLKGLVLLSPLLGLPATMLPIRYILKQVRKYADEVQLPKPIQIKQLSRTPSAWKRYKSDPYRVHVISPELLENFYRYMERVHKNSNGFSYPLLCFYSQNDKVVSPAAIEKFFKTYSFPDKTMVAYVEAMHELIQEKECSEVTNKIFSWIHQRT